MNFGEIFKNSFKYPTLNFKKLLILGIFFLIYRILTALGIYWMFSTELFKTMLILILVRIMPKKWSFYLRNVRLKLLKLVEERLKELMVKC